MTPSTQNASSKPTARRVLAANRVTVAAITGATLVAVIAVGFYLYASRSSRVDQLVILTVPSGAEIRLNATDYGTSPVKLEQLETGIYTLTITKGGFEPVDEQIEIRESKRLAFTLKPIAPKEFAGLTAEERLRGYEKSAQESFDKGRLAIPYQDSALYFAALILADDPTSQFGLEMRDRIHGILIQNARSATARGDVGQAQEIYNTLIEQYPDDEEARLAQIKLDAQLSQRRGEVRELVRKADEALRAGDLLDPPRANAYYYSKEALAIDRTNKDARAIRGEINSQLTSSSERAADRGDFQEAMATHEKIVSLFPDDQAARERLRQLEVEREAQVRANDPAVRRVRGLENYRDEKFREAIPDLEYALYNGRGGPEVVFSLARSLHKLRQLDKAALYYREIQPSNDDVYRSAIAALGDIAHEQGNPTLALERYKEARRLGGSAIYTPGILDERIERIESKRREKEAEPIPVTIQVRHQHGGLIRGECRGPLTVNSTGVRYDGSDSKHVFSSNLEGVAVRIVGDELVLQLQGTPQKFRVAKAEAERFREGLSKYQQARSTK